MRVLMLSKAAVTGIYQPKFEAIAQAGVELKVLAPPAWQDERGAQPLERSHTRGYDLQAIPMRLNGHFHLHHYPTLWRELRGFAPQIVHIDEEPYNLAAWQALWGARRFGAKTLVFSWQNIQRAYPPPFSWGERWVLRRVDYALAGTADAGAVLRAKGYRGPLAVIPQFGTSSTLFQPPPARPERPFTVGFFGRVVAEKGIGVLLRALAQLAGEWRLRVVGGGPARAEMQTLAKTLCLGGRTTFVAQLPSAALPAEYHKIDVLVLPSLTRRNWKEQFGRVLVEAMASGVAVIGSDSGAIPQVIGDAGLVTAEGDVDALAAALQRVRDDAALRAALVQRGRSRFHSQFTHASIARSTVAVYEQMLGGQ